MEELQVLSVQTVQRTNSGEYTYVVLVGFECPRIERLDESKNKEIHMKVDIPGVPNRAPAMPIEQKVVLYFSEQEWQRSKKKFVVGEKVKLGINKGGSITLS